jgi:aminoglycoside phosphotransferase (APT) family kinase protein
MPRIGWAIGQAAKEREWLPRLAPHLPLAIPAPIASGRPAGDYPFEWSIYEWLPGGNANSGVEDLQQAAVDLAQFISALREVDTTGAHPRPVHGRGGPLIEGDEQVRRSITELGDRINGAAALGMWEESLAAPAWEEKAGSRSASTRCQPTPTSSPVTGSRRDRRRR